MKTAELRWNATVYSGGTPSKDRADFWEGGTIPWLNSGAVNDWRITEPSALITEEAIASSSARWIPAQSVVIALAGQGRTKGTAARLEVATTCNQSMAAIVPSSRLDYRFLHYVLHSMYEPIRNMAGGDLRDGLNLQHIGNIRIPVIPLEEQRRIADFLDDQVARVDAAIAARQKQQSQLDLYVTSMCFDMVRGAEVSGPRRDSGIDWLGDIPMAWHEAPAGAAYSILLGKMLDESTFTGEHALPYLRNTNVQWDEVNTTDLKLMDIAPNERERFTVMRGDLLICEGGQPGRCAVWDGSIAEIGYQKALHRARPRSGNDVRWLQNFLRAAVAVDALGGRTGQSTIGHLTGEQLRGLKMPLPDPSEQVRLVSAFEVEMERVREFRRALERSLDLLSHYKRSVITAAVTGELEMTTARLEVPV